MYFVAVIWADWIKHQVGNLTPVAFAVNGILKVFPNNRDLQIDSDYRLLFDG